MSSDESAIELEGSGIEMPKLPNMNEFSPGQLDSKSIKSFLSLLDAVQGDDTAPMRDFIAANVAAISSTTDAIQRGKRAQNVLIGMSQCGLLGKNAAGRNTARFTDLAMRLLNAASNSEADDLFAAHLIENCHGRDLIEAVRSIRTRGDEVTLAEIRAELRSRGFKVTENEGNPSKIRQWLQHSRVIDDAWEIDDSRLEQVIGATSETLASWQSLSRAQKVMLLRLRENTLPGSQDWVQVRQLKRHCELRHGRKIFPEGRLRAAVIDPLVIDGWVLADGLGSGRGGDSGRIKATDKLLAVRISLPLESVASVPTDLLDKLGTSLDDIFRDIGADDTHVAGLGLELLALRIIRDINLYPDRFRARSASTGGAEVDLIANGVHLHYSRWLVQCKNTRVVDVGVIAKEAGLALVMRAQVIMLVTTGRFAPAVLSFAKALAETSALQAVLIDGSILRRYRERGGIAILDWLEDSAQKVLLHKRTQSSAESD